ncbi:MAG TPA: hypothetical protein VLE47_02145 [Candidatus Saccharimonadales bacterium]|nr:hypothetical protein [Candidatus Saccharimonadales bacterium]
MEIKVKRFDKTLPLPDYEKGAACFDLPCRESTTIQPKEIKLIPLNVSVQIPEGFALLVFARSSTPWKKGLLVANSVGIVDPFYRGDKDEVLIELLNFSDKEVQIEKGELLAQGMIVKYETATWSEVNAMGEEGSGGYKQD